MIASQVEGGPVLSSPNDRNGLGVIKDIVGDHVNLAIFFAATCLVAFGYSLFLPFEFTQRLTLHNWAYVDGRLIAFSVAFGVAVGWMAAVQVHALRQVIRRRGNSLGAVGAVFAALPSLLCCTPVVPTILGAVGVSGVSLAHTSGRIQSFFATNQNAILSASVALVVTAAVWATQRVAHADCLHPAGCAVDPDVENENHSHRDGLQSLSGRDPVGSAHGSRSDR
jgi:hypothetical protein